MPQILSGLIQRPKVSCHENGGEFALQT